jgi:hypothetical protein
MKAYKIYISITWEKLSLHLTLRIRSTLQMISICILNFTDSPPHFYSLVFFFFFLKVLGFDLKAYQLERQVLHHLSCAFSPFGSGYFLELGLRFLHRPPVPILYLLQYLLWQAQATMPRFFLLKCDLVNQAGLELRSFQSHSPK